MTDYGTVARELASHLRLKQLAYRFVMLGL